MLSNTGQEKDPNLFEESYFSSNSIYTNNAIKEEFQKIIDNPKKLAHEKDNI